MLFHFENKNPKLFRVFWVWVTLVFSNHIVVGFGYRPSRRDKENFILLAGQDALTDFDLSWYVYVMCNV